MTAEVALGLVGMVLGLEVSRLARNNANWYRFQWNGAILTTIAKRIPIPLKSCKPLAEDAVYWEGLSSVVGRVLATGGKGGKE